MKLITEPSTHHPVWIAIRGDKFVVAQDQDHAARCFIQHYSMVPEVVINGLYFTKPVYAV